MPENPAQKHGTYSYKTSGVVPEQFPHVLEAGERFRMGLLSAEAMATGSDVDMNMKRLALIDSAQRVYIIIRLLFDDVLTRGVRTTKGKTVSKEVNFCLKMMTSYENTLRLTLAQLGLQREQRPVMELCDYISETYVQPPEPSVEEPVEEPPEQGETGPK